MPSQSDLLTALSTIDWNQVVANGGPPCFHLESEEGSAVGFCLRAERWEGHSSFHPFVSLNDMIESLGSVQYPISLNDHEAILLCDALFDFSKRHDTSAYGAELNALENRLTALWRHIPSEQVNEFRNILLGLKPRPPIITATDPSHPWTCPSCHRPISGNEIQFAFNGTASIVFHNQEGCKAVLGVQLMAIPQQTIVPAGGIPDLSRWRQ